MTITHYQATKFIVISILTGVTCFGLNFLGEALDVEWLRKTGLLLFFGAFGCAVIGILVLILLMIRDLFKK